MRQRIVLIITSLLFLPGCPWWNHVVVPPAPVPVIGSDPGAVAFEHDVEISWRATDLEVLQSLSVSFPGKISILQDPAKSELSVQLQIFVQKENQDSLSSEYTHQILAASKLDVVDAALNVPVPTHPCQQTHDAHGNVTDLKGVCPVQMTLIVPSAHAVPITAAPDGDFSSQSVALPRLQLSLKDGAHASINQIVGGLKIAGGGAKSIVQVDGASSLDLELDAIELAQLQHVSGALHIALAHPNPADPNEVSVDGKPITSFPFDRP